MLMAFHYPSCALTPTPNLSSFSSQNNQPLSNSLAHVTPLFKTLPQFCIIIGLIAVHSQPGQLSAPHCVLASLVLFLHQDCSSFSVFGLSTGPFHCLGHNSLFRAYSFLVSRSPLPFHLFKKTFPKHAVYSKFSS